MNFNLMQILGMLQNTNNPMQILNQLSVNNPQLQGLMQNLQGKTPLELKQYAQNMAQARGVDLSQYMKQFGLNI